MLYTAEEIIAPGGPSAPVWVFLTTILTLLITSVFTERRQRAERRESAQSTKQAAEKATEAAEHAAQAVDNTKNVSNGFARSVVTGQNAILAAVQDIDARLSEHIAQHQQEAENGSQQADERDSVRPGQDEQQWFGERAGQD